MIKIKIKNIQWIFFVSTGFELSSNSMTISMIFSIYTIILEKFQTILFLGHF